jgi:GNAT superfamily N-acetyltransferase
MTTVRDARPSDALALVPLLTELGYPAPLETVTTRLSTVAAEGARVLVAESDGEVRAVAVVHPMMTLHRQAPVAYLSALVVDPTARGMGLGRALVDAAAAIGAEWGCGTLELTSNDRRVDAHRFYTSLGFVSESRKFRRAITPP